MKTLFKTTAIALTALSATLAPAAFAVPAADKVSVTIDTRYLETDWGVEKVYNVLSRKAESACTTGSTRGLAARKAERDCMSDLLDEFIVNADEETLSTYHARVTS